MADDGMDGGLRRRGATLEGRVAEIERRMGVPLGEDPLRRSEVSHGRGGGSAFQHAAEQRREAFNRVVAEQSRVEVPPPVVEPIPVKPERSVIEERPAKTE